MLDFRDYKDVQRQGKGSAEGGPRVCEGNLTPMGFQAVVNLAVAVGLIQPSDIARIALIQAEGDDVRWRDDGVNPTAAVGMLLENGRDFFYTGDVATIKFIETTGGGKLNVSYYS